MKLIEWIIIIAVIIFAVFSVLVIIFRKRKKIEQKDEKPEGKVEPVYKPKEEKKESDAAEKEKPDDEKKDENVGFKIIKRQEGVKINKKALDAQSRNPSVTKVFGKDGELEKKQKEEKALQEKVAAEQVNSNKKIEPFFPRDYEYDEVNTDDMFKIVTPDGQPVRTPEIKNRSDFASHLNVSEDGNLSGVVGIGLDKALNSAQSQLKEIEDKNQQMIKRAHGVVNIDDMDDDFNYLEQRIRQMRESMEVSNEKSGKKISLKDIDPKTLIVAEAIANPKYKNNKKIGEEN